MLMQRLAGDRLKILADQPDEGQRLLEQRAAVRAGPGCLHVGGCHARQQRGQCGIAAVGEAEEKQPEIVDR